MQVAHTNTNIHQLCTLTEAVVEKVVLQNLRQLLRVREEVAKKGWGKLGKRRVIRREDLFGKENGGACDYVSSQ